MKREGVSYLGTGAGAVHDGVAAVERPGVGKPLQTLARFLITGVDDPTVGLNKTPILLIHINMCIHIHNHNENLCFRY